MKKMKYDNDAVQKLANILGVSVATARKYYKEYEMMQQIEKEKNKKLHIILASKSERRKEILFREGYNFEIYVPKAKEKDIIGKKYSDELVNECAKDKAKNAYEELKAIDKSPNTLSNDSINNTKITINDTSIIVSCDTVVVNDNIIIGKPKDRDDAIRILKSLSGKRHKVVSALCICRNGEYYVKNETTFVTFRKIENEELEKFVDEKKPYDKSGAYAIQDEKYVFAEKIEGSIDNVVGFPIELFKEMLETLNCQV